MKKHRLDVCETGAEHLGFNLDTAYELTIENNVASVKNESDEEIPLLDLIETEVSICIN